MKLQLLSDLHLEMQGFYSIEATDADVVILAGDIGVGLKGMEWAIAESNRLNKPVIYVAGNHEFYRHHYQTLLTEMRALANTSPYVSFLENDVIEIHGVRFLGATLWTNYKVDGRAKQSFNMQVIGQMLNDHRMIGFGENHYDFTPADALALHNTSIAWLEAKLSEPFSGKTVVVTHHGPSLKCAHSNYGLDHLSAGFISNCELLVEQADVWCFGHTHSNLDTPIGQCRLISNQKGYPRESVPGDFDKNLIIEV